MTLKLLVTFGRVVDVIAPSTNLCPLGRKQVTIFVQFKTRKYSTVTVMISSVTMGAFAAIPKPHIFNNLPTTTHTNCTSDGRKHSSRLQHLLAK